MSCDNAMDALTACVEELEALCEVERARLAADYERFVAKRRQDGRRATNRYVNRVIMKNKSLSEPVKAQVQRLIGALGKMPEITPTENGRVWFEWRDPFCGYLWMELSGGHYLQYIYCEPCPSIEKTGGYVREREVPEAVKRFYAQPWNREEQNG